MKKLTLNTLLVNDDDLECEKPKEEVTLDDIYLCRVGFIASDLERFDMVIYKGRLGQKILKLRGI